MSDQKASSETRPARTGKRAGLFALFLGLVAVISGWAEVVDLSAPPRADAVALEVTATVTNLLAGDTVQLEVLALLEDARSCRCCL